MEATRTMTFAHGSGEARPLAVNWLFTASVFLLFVYVAFIVGAGCEYAAQIDKLALAGTGGF